MQYNLGEYFSSLWGGNIFKGTRSKAEEAKLKWRTMMAKRPIEERYAMSDEEYEKLELQNHKETL